MIIKFFRIVSTVHDASAKVPSGILSGNINQLGDFDECLNVKAPNNEFAGKYCLTYVQMTVPDYLPKLGKIRKLLHSHDAFVNDFDDVSVTNIFIYRCLLFFFKSNYGQVQNVFCFSFEISNKLHSKYMPCCGYFTFVWCVLFATV